MNTLDAAYSATTDENRTLLKYLLIQSGVIRWKECYPGCYDYYIGLSEIQKLYDGNVYVRATNNPEA